MDRSTGSYTTPSSARIIARTNKAIVYEDTDGSVAKRYHTVDAVERVRQDERSLGQVWQALTHERDADGWQYTVTRPLRVDVSSGTIWLERAPGQAVFALPSNALLDAEYRVGIWLATYHNRLLGEADKGVIYADTNVNNILIDPVDKIVAGLDPGSEWGHVGSRYEDVIRHAYSLIVALLQRRRGSLPAVRSFLQGYASATLGRMSTKTYAAALGKEARRRWRHYGAKSRRKQLAYAAGTVLLAPFFAFYVPRVLARAIRAARARHARRIANG